MIDLAKRYQDATEEEITIWVNSKTDNEQFTPLHFASFKGNLDAVHSLISNKADKDEENFFGLNMLHVAAQGDSAPSLFLFKDLNVDINK